MRLFSFGGRTVERDPVVDIEHLIVDYAWNEVADTNIFDRIFKKKKYILEVNWSYLDITHHLTSFRLRNQSSTEESSSTRLTIPSQKYKLRTSADKLRSKILQRDLCLFRTEFTNTSEEAQTFTFKTERKTTSRCDVNIQRGFRIGGNVDVRVSLPTAPIPKPDMIGAGEIDTCRITGGLSGELHVTKATGQTIEENLTWGVDSQVKVEGRSRVVASLMIREEELTADFVIVTVLRATNSVIPVYVRDRKTKKLLELLEISSDNLPDILRSDKGFEKLDETSVQCHTKGRLRAVYGAEQVIRVDSFKDFGESIDASIPGIGMGDCIIEEA